MPQFDDKVDKYTLYHVIIIIILQLIMQGGTVVGVLAVDYHGIETYANGLERAPVGYSEWRCHIQIL